MTAEVEPGIYRHFKGQLYEVVGIGRDVDTLDEMVFYRKLYDDYTFWIRSVAEFTELVEREGYKGIRFVRII